MIRRLASALAACTLSVAVASCGGNLAPIAASLAPAVASPETIATMRTWCARGATVINIAESQSTIPAAKEIARFVGPFCLALASGQVPATTDANSPDWLAKNIVGLSQALGLSLRQVSP